MSSPDSTKKRRLAVDNSDGDDSGIVDDGSSTAMSKILAKLNDMETEMNGMNSRLSRMDELEGRCNTMQNEMDSLQKKCTNLDARCESLELSVQILSDENKWEYSAPPVPLSHWRGFNEDYINQMQKFWPISRGIHVN